MAGSSWQRLTTSATSTASSLRSPAEAHSGFRYNYALQALSHALLLAPQNPFYVLEFAEIAYASGDIPLAVKTFLMAVDMTDDEDTPVTSYQTDITLRAWYGVKLVRHIHEIENRKLMTSLELTSPGAQHPIAISDSSPNKCRAD